MLNELRIFESLRNMNEAKLRFAFDPKNISSDGKTYKGSLVVTSDQVKGGVMTIPQFDTVTESFTCSGLGLKTLKNSPKRVGTYYDCTKNKLSNLKYGPVTVGARFSCNSNHIDSLEEGPDSVGGVYSCSVNKLKSFKGVPKILKSSFNGSHNQVSTLKGGSEQIGDWYWIDFNELKSLEYAPKKAHRFSCKGNPGKFTKKDVRAVCKVVGKIEV